MRLHIELDDELVKAIDEKAGARGRTQFIREAVLAELDSRRRWDLIRSARGSIPAYGHEWDEDPAAWVRAQRRGPGSRVG